MTRVVLVFLAWMALQVAFAQPPKQPQTSASVTGGPEATGYPGRQGHTRIERGTFEESESHADVARRHFLHRNY